MTIIRPRLFWVKVDFFQNHDRKKITVYQQNMNELSIVIALSLKF